MVSKIEKLEDDQQRLLKGRMVFAGAAIVCIMLTGACAFVDLFNIGAGPETLLIWGLVALAMLIMTKVIGLSEDLIEVQRALISEYKAQ